MSRWRIPCDNLRIIVEPITVEKAETGRSARKLDRNATVPLAPVSTVYSIRGCIEHLGSLPEVPVMESADDGGLYDRPHRDAAFTNAGSVREDHGPAVNGGLGPD